MWSDFGSKKGPKGTHFGRQNGATIDPKSRCKFKSEIVTPWSRLGSKLARCSLRLGVNNIEFYLVLLNKYWGMLEVIESMLRVLLGILGVLWVMYFGVYWEYLVLRLSGSTYCYVESI